MLDLISDEYEENFGAIGSIVAVRLGRTRATNVQYILSVINEHVSTDLSQYTSALYC